MDKLDLPPNPRTDEQNELHKQLQSISDGAASFYLDALQISEDTTLRSQTNLVAHLSREIDSTIRDVLASKSMLDHQLTLSTSEIEAIREKVNAELESKGLDKVAVLDKTVLSVCNALGLNKKTDLIEEWVFLTAQFHAFAHRKGMKAPRDFSSFRDIWSRYEKVLFRLIGSYYNLNDTIMDGILKKDSPSKEILEALPNLFKLEAREFYFFSKLDKIGWLKPLSDAGFFDPDKNPKPSKRPDGKGYSHPYWSILRYLEKITPKAKNGDLDLIIAIIKTPAVTLPVLLLTNIP
mgnify:CR=1 FL=1